MRSIILVCIVVCFSFAGHGQQLLGMVIDNETRDPLIGANILMASAGDSIYTISNKEGMFSFETERANVELKISYLGFETVKMDANITSELLVIRMNVDESNISISPIIIANPFSTNDVKFNRKEFQILPGAYEDPSRLLLKAPGFSTSNDQANYILYKGFPSNYVNWNINGSTIVNPNHLSNAGSLTDVSNATAGGVNMMSGQVIGTYDFQSAPYDLPFNNTMAGSSDVEFSNYNNSYINLSLVGLEAGYGYDGKKLPKLQLNYRYSFVGILTNVLGLDFGGEKIAYQDFFARTTLIDKENESLSAFAILGSSSNIHNPVEERDESSSFKDISDIKFNSSIFLSGLRYERKLSSYGLKANVNYSRKSDVRSAMSSLPDFTSRDDINQQLVSSIVQVDKILEGSALRFGVKLNLFLDARNNQVLRFPENALEFQNFNLMPFMNWQKEREHYFVDIGTGLTYNSLSKNLNLEPNIKLVGKIDREYSVEFAYRRNSQLLSSVNFNYAITPRESVGDHFESSIKMNKQKFGAFVTGFYHSMGKLLVEKNSNYSQFTGLDHPFIQDYSFDGKARSYGVSLGFSTNDILIKNLDFSANYTTFEAKYSNFDNEWFDNTFSFDHSFNILIGYAINFNKDKEIIISLSTHNRGGLREFDIELARSFYSYEVVYDYNSSPQHTLNPYSRIDFRLLYNIRKGKYRKMAQSLSLDIQNLASKENDAFSSVDFYTGESTVLRQLGMVPVLAYRIEF